ncbi:hypothetical protein Moror_4309 [Moniliophthora roreri MCA 2997]|uniref:Uncharacterized protein n=2 Tax=Moniliophthora roreri TaxID=221103 RepID=V2W1Z8_MONRO|nr:hypothetical protein Moror_4309 [Moniliophthora roreri MCA 2997]
MSIFPSASNFTIEDGDFTAIARDQYQYNNHGTLVQYLGRQERERTILDEYTRVPVGKVYIKRSISVTDVRRQNILSDHQHWSRVDALRSINIASIHGEDKDLEFVYVCYDGQDASEAFRRDFEQFSRVRNVHTAQLFGYNDGPFTLPALIFYDALIPVMHIWERNNFSPLLFAYLCHRLLENPIANHDLDFGELWMNPRTGALCVGPYVDYSFHRLCMNYTNKDQVITGNYEYPFLSLQLYHDSDAIFDFLVQNFDTSEMLYQICKSYRYVMEWIPDEDTVPILSSLPGAVYSRTRREIIAKWPKTMNERHYRAWDVEGVPDTMFANARVDNDNSVCFAVTVSDIQHLRNREFNVDYQPCSQRKRKICAFAWPIQAHSVLGERGSQEEWGEYSLLRGFSIHFRCRNEHLSTRSCKFSADKVYLIIREVPRSSASKTIWNAWLQEPKYFWGLPSFTIRLRIVHLRWSHIAYTSIHQLHILKGFDPATRDLALSLHLPLLENVGDETRFEEIKAHSTQDFQPMDVDSELAESLSTLTVNAAKGAMDPLLKTVENEAQFEVTKAQSIQDFQPMNVDNGLPVSLSTLTVDVEEDAMDID